MDNNKNLENFGSTESIIENKIEIREDLSSEIIESLKSIPGGNAGLIVLKGPKIGEKFLITEDIFNIGREADSDIFLEDITVSRNHAKILKHEEQYEISDLGSLNGIYINGNLSEKKELKNGDRIQIGKYIFYFFHLD